MATSGDTTATRMEHEHLCPMGHTIYEIARGLKLVFKPAGHRESIHLHSFGQRICVLRGRLEVMHGELSTMLDRDSDSMFIPAEEPHSTLALMDSWIIAEEYPHVEGV